MAFQNQKENILKFYENTNGLIKQHQEIYDKLVNKLNKKESLSHTLINNLDDFAEYSFPEFNEFRKSIQDNDLNNDVIDYVFDINKNEYVSNFQLSDKKIIIKQHFNLVKVGFISTDNIYNVNNELIEPHTIDLNITAVTKKKSFRFKHKVENKNFEYNSIRLGNGNRFDFNTYVYILQNSFEAYEPNEKINLEFYIDDYFNIYIPKMRTYLVFNYSKFPLYAFYNNMDKMNLYHNFIEENVRTIYFNEFCEEDIKEYNSIKTFIEPINSFVSSLDKRNEYKELFPKLLEFYKYKDKNDFFIQYKVLSEKLEQVSPSKSFKKVESNDEYTMNDEKKIYSQSVRIKELEIENSKYFEELEYLRNERKTFIQKYEDSNSKLSSYEKLLEELNTQLHDNIDKNSLQQKEIIELKCKNIEYSELVNKNRRFEDEIQKLQNKIIELGSEINKYKTLNNTLIDKQTELNQKLLQDRNNNKKDKETVKELNIKLENNRIKIIQLETSIKQETETNKLNKKKIEEMLSNVLKCDNSSDNTYQELLLQQIKDKNLEIENLKKNINSNKEENESIMKKYELLKNQLKDLFNN